MTLSLPDLTTALQWRYATKQFDASKTLDPKTLNALLESLQLTPSSLGLQPWRFIVVTNHAVREKLKAASFNQPQVTDASHCIVLCSRKGAAIDESYVDQYLATIADVQGKTMDDLAPYKQMMLGYLKMNPTPESRTLWSQKQAYIALGQLMTSAALLHVDTCPMEGFIAEKYDEILGLTDTDYTTTLVCPVGYRSEDDRSAARAKVRFPLSDIVEFVE